MDLTGFKKKTATAWFDFDNEKAMRVQLRYISPEEANKELRDCTKTVNGRDQYDDEKGIQVLAARILAWEGFTLRRIAEMIPIEVPEDQLDNLVVCSEANKIELLRQSWQFRPFVEKITASLAEFTAARREAEKKILLSSPSGPSAAAQAAKPAAQ